MLPFYIWIRISSVFAFGVHVYISSYGRWMKKITRPARQPLANFEKGLRPCNQLRFDSKDWVPFSFCESRTYSCLIILATGLLPDNVPVIPRTSLSGKTKMRRNSPVILAYAAWGFAKESSIIAPDHRSRVLASNELTPYFWQNGTEFRSNGRTPQLATIFILAVRSRSNGRARAEDFGKPLSYLGVMWKGIERGSCHADVAAR
jgi:hypothetical protein